MTGYSRAQFGAAWTDNNDDPDGHNGCRTRDDILARDLTHVTRRSDCTVLSGVLVDSYTGKTIVGTARVGPRCADNALPAWTLACIGGRAISR